MRNLDYWRKFAGLARFRQDMEILEVPRISLGSHTRDFLHKAVAFLVCRDLRKAYAYMERAGDWLLQKLDGNPGPDDYMWLFLIGWIRDSRLDTDKVAQALLMNGKELGMWILKKGQLDLFRMYQALEIPDGPASLDKKIAQDFITQSKLMYPYVEGAVSFLEYARRCLITGDFVRGGKGAVIARDLCRMAVQRIPRTMTIIDRRWESVEHNVIDFSSFSPGTREDYVNLRERLTGNIPRLVRETDLVDMISSSARGQIQRLKGMKTHPSWLFSTPRAIFQESRKEFVAGSRNKKIPKKELGLPLGRMVSEFFNRVRSTLASGKKGKPLGMLRVFFDEYVNPPDIPRSQMGLLHALEWVVIRSRLEKINSSRLGENPEYFIREYLG